MREIIAIIRPNKAKLTKQRLAEKGFVAYTEERVSGRGRERGLRYSQGHEGDAGGGISFLPKRMITVFVSEKDIEGVVAALTETNKTGEIGDGKIFICPAEDALRIRTDERSRAALV